MAPPIPNCWTTHSEYIELLNYLTQKAKDAKSPMSILSLVKEFKEKSGAAQTEYCLMQRIENVRTRIHNFENIDTNTKVKLMFALSASVDANFLKKMKKETIVEVDDKKRITHYKSNDGSLELRGDHSRSEKIRTAKLESKGSLRSLITDYFENKNDADAVPKNKDEKEIRDFIEFITQKCENVNSPLTHRQLTKDFNNHFGLSRSLDCIHKRIRAYCHEIQKTEFLDISSKVKQLFGLSATVDSNYLEKLRKDAFVEVDKLNRITKYTENNGRLTLHGAHSQSAKQKLAWIGRKERLNAVKKHSNSGGDEKEESEKGNGYSEEDSDEYSSEEFGSEFDSDDENGSLDEADHRDSSNEVLDFDNETPIRNRLPVEMSIDDNFDFDPPFERSHKSEETERSENEENEPGITGNESVKIRHGRLSKRRHLDPAFSNNQMNSTNSATPRSTDSSSSKPAKQKKMAIEKEQALRSLNQSRSSSRSIRRSTRNSSFPSTSTDSEVNMENQDAPRAVDFESETPIRAPSPNDNDFGFDPPTERSHRSEETEMREDEEKENNPEITANPSVKTRTGRLSKRRHLDSEFSYNLANSRTSATSRSTVSSSSKPAKQKKMAVETSNSSNPSTSSSRPIRRPIGRSSSPSISTESAERMKNQDALDADRNPSDYHGPRIQAMDDYEYNPREDNLPESSPIDNHIEDPKPQVTEEHNTNNEAQNTDRRSDTVASEPKPEKESLALQNNQNSTSQTNGNEFISVESHIRLLDSLLPMMKTFETPTLEEDELRIEKSIEKIKSMGNEGEKIRMNEIRTSLMTCLLIVEKSAKKEDVKREDTTSLKEFLLVFQSFLFSLKIKELDSFVTRTKHMIKELKDNDKKFPTRNIQLALQSIIEIIAP